MGTTDMRTCIMLIAGPFEKDYIEEWVEWHHDICGFKEVFVIANMSNLKTTTTRTTSYMNSPTQTCSDGGFRTWTGNASMGQI